MIVLYKEFLICQKNTKKDELLLEKFNINSKENFENFISEVTKSFIKKSLDVEMDHHLGYEKWDQNSREISDNYRKGTTPKTVATKFSNLEIDIPRDSSSTFKPKLVKKHQRNINDIEEKVINLKGLSEAIKSAFPKTYYSKMYCPSN